jgi:ribosomal protein S18 acetylase RimI-like enzyme
LALHLGQSHSAVSQMSRKLLGFKVVRESRDPVDERRRLLALSPQGKALMQRLAPVWQAIESAVAELEAAHPLSDSLTALDQHLSRQPFSRAIRAHMGKTGPDTVEIISYQAKYRHAFKRLNLEWLHKYFYVEPLDEQVLSRPGDIIRNGGAIFFARLREEIVGTCALVNAGPGANKGTGSATARFELSKMAVTEGMQGLGVGRSLLAAAIRTFEAGGGGELFLETNSQLVPAIRLYESMGFRHAVTPAGASHYARANVYMVYAAPSAPACGINR